MNRKTHAESEGLKKSFYTKTFIYLGNIIKLPPLLSVVFDNIRHVTRVPFECQRLFTELFRMLFVYSQNGRNTDIQKLFCGISLLAFI